GAGFDHDVERLDPGVYWITPGLAGADIEFPAMPGAAQQLPFAREAVLARLGRLGQTDDAPFAQRGTLVRAPVRERVERAVHVEAADLAPARRDKLAGTGRDVAALRDNVPAHRHLNGSTRYFSR